MASLVTYLGTRKFRWRMLRLVRAGFSLFGRGWNDFYAWMLDFQDRNVTLDQILRRRSAPGKFKGLWDWQRGDYYADFMERHGVQPYHTILDYGCGYGRVVIPLLRRQRSGGRLIGTEISEKRLELCRQWIEREGLTRANYDLVLSKDNTMPFLNDASIDVVWVLSVFNHMPDAELGSCLSAIARVLKKGGLLFCYYLTNDADVATVKTFRRGDDDMMKRLSSLSFSMQRCDDFDSDLITRFPDARMILAVKS